jgi:hypothetical protein
MIHMEIVETWRRGDEGDIEQEREDYMLIYRF